MSQNATADIGKWRLAAMRAFTAEHAPASVFTGVAFTCTAVASAIVPSSDVASFCIAAPNFIRWNLRAWLMSAMGRLRTLATIAISRYFIAAGPHCGACFRLLKLRLARSSVKARSSPRASLATSRMNNGSSSTALRSTTRTREGRDRPCSRSWIARSWRPYSGAKYERG